MDPAVALSDDEAWAASPQQTNPAPVVYSPSQPVPGVAGTPVTPAQSTYAQAAIASGATADPTTAPGATPQQPTYDSPTVTGDPSTFHVTTGGQLSSPASTDATLSDQDAWAGQTPSVGPPPLTKSDEGLGFQAGLIKPLDNAAFWMEKGLTALGIPAAGIEHAMGMPSAANTMAAHQAVLAKAASQGIKPGAIGGLIGGALGSAPVAMLPGGILAQGAASGALNTNRPDDLGSVALDSGIGAIGGGLIGGGMSLASKAAAPVLSKTLQTLVDAGVPVTPGQAAGAAGGFFGDGLKRIEDAATSIPIVGDAVRSAQRRGIIGFNKAAINHSLEPLGIQLPGGFSAGHNAIQYADAAVDSAYNNAAKSAGTVSIDPQFAQDAQAISAKMNTLGGSFPTRYADIIQKEVANRINPGGTFDADKFIDAKAGLNAAIKTYSGATDPDSVDFVQGLQNFKSAMLGNLGRSSPQAASQLQAADAAFARLATVQKAAGSLAAAKDGIFTPPQLLGAVKSADTSARKNAFSMGNAQSLNPLASAGASILPSSVPDSGTALRYLVSELPILLGVGSESHILPMAAAAPALIGGGLIGSAYTRVGQGILNSVLKNSNPALRRTLGAAVAPAAAAGGAGTNLLTNQSLGYLGGAGAAR